MTIPLQGGMGPSVILAPQIAPPDYCGMAWFACLFCFWPTGICAILKSNEVSGNGYSTRLLKTGMQRPQQCFFTCSLHIGENHVERENCCP